MKVTNHFMENEDYEKSNREKTMAPKSDGAIWCGGCDAELVYEGKQCSCGWKFKTKRLKKDT